MPQVIRFSTRILISLFWGRGGGRASNPGHGGDVFLRIAVSPAC